MTQKTKRSAVGSQVPKNLNSLLNPTAPVAIQEENKIIEGAKLEQTQETEEINISTVKETEIKIEEEQTTKEKKETKNTSTKKSKMPTIEEVLNTKCPEQFTRAAASLTEAHHKKLKLLKMLSPDNKIGIQDIVHTLLDIGLKYYEADIEELKNNL